MNVPVCALTNYGEQVENNMYGIHRCQVQLSDFLSFSKVKSCLWVLAMMFPL